MDRVSVGFTIKAGRPRSMPRKGERKVSTVAPHVEHRHAFDRTKRLDGLVDHAVIKFPHRIVGGKELLTLCLSRDLAGQKILAGIIRPSVRAIDRRRIFGVPRRDAEPGSHSKIIAEYKGLVAQ